MFEADDKYKNMSPQQAKQILGDRTKWELEIMLKALTKMRAMNTEEEEQRLASVRVILKNLKLEGEKK